MGKRILVTGVAGFIGSHVARRQREEGYQVFGVDDLSRGFEKSIPEGIEFIRGDLSDRYSEGGTPGDQFGIYADTTRLREVTGMEGFVPLAKGLGPFISWAKQPL